MAARRRHLAGCQTRWGPPSNSSDQNKGSVKNTDSCNISPGPGSHSISQNTDAEIYFFSSTHMNIYEYFLGVIAYIVVVIVGLMQRKLGEQFPFMPPLRTFGVRLIQQQKYFQSWLIVSDERWRFLQSVTPPPVVQYCTIKHWSNFHIIYIICSEIQLQFLINVTKSYIDVNVTFSN